MILTVIYLGNKLPKYVLSNLEYLKATFPDEDLYFISDCRKSIAKANQKGIKTWLAPNPEMQWQGVRAELDHPLEFRDGFWFKTLARIFVLNSFMQVHQNQEVLQIEADVFLFPSFPISKFIDLNVEISFPMESYDRGIASILYLKNHKISEKLTDIALIEFENNKNLTDMLLLGNIAHSRLLNFLPLPTLPNDMQNALNDANAFGLVCNNSINTSGVFDGISVGQYLLGIDPRNSRGLLKLYRSQSSHAINVNNLTLGLNIDENVVLKDSGRDILVFNLHNHAKDLRLYKGKSRKKLLQKRVKSSGQGEIQELVIKVFLVSVFKSIIRKVRNGLHQQKI